MSVDLMIWANHSLSFNSAQEGIDKLENLCLRKVRNWNFKSHPPLTQTTHLSEVEYFTNFDILDQNFELWKELRIWTNFQFCDEINLYKTTLRIKPRGFYTRYSKWLQLVSGKREIEESGNAMEEHRKNWLLFRKYSHEITRRLSGDTLIYLNDHSYQLQEDDFYGGLPFEELIRLLTEIRKPCELKLLELFPDDPWPHRTWHYETL